MSSCDPKQTWDTPQISPNKTSIVGLDTKDTLIIAQSLKRERGWLRAPFGGNAVCLV